MPYSNWGANDRYYSDAKPTGRALKDKQSLAKEWEKIVESLDPGIEKRIQRAYKQWNLIVRDQLRNETALRLSHGDHQVSVPVKIIGGIPDPLMAPLENLLEIGPLLLRKETIQRSIQGVAFVRDYRVDVVGFLERCGHDKEGIAGDSNLESVHQLLEALSAELNKIEPLQKIWGLQVDVLGAYFFRRPEVELYWLAIAIMASIAGVDAEPLTFVTLTHELAHAYTHLGRDIDGNQWNTEDFAMSDDHIVEGLAQHYTHAVCQKLQFRYPAPLEVFNKLLESQSSPYTCFKDWIQDKSDPGEHIRGCMIQARKRRITSYDGFLKEISPAKQINALS